MPVSSLVPPPPPSSTVRNLQIGGGLLFPIILGACWLKFGHLTGLMIGAAAGTSAIIESIAAVKLMQMRRALQLSRPQREPSGQESGMKVQLCRRALERLGANREPLLDALRDRQHTPIVRECLSRCQECNSGMLMAIADGVPLSTTGPDQLLGDLDELSADEP